jgi:hypothetical protein
MTATLETRTTPTWDQYRGRLEEYFDRTALDAWAPVPTGLADAGAAAGKAAGWWAAAAVTSANALNAGQPSSAARSVADGSWWS